VENMAALGVGVGVQGNQLRQLTMNAISRWTGNRYIHVCMYS